MFNYEELVSKVQSIKTAAENAQEILHAIRTEALEKIDELVSISGDVEEVSDEIYHYLSNLVGMQATLEKADGIRDAAEMQGITI